MSRESDQADEKVLDQLLYKGGKRNLWTPWSRRTAGCHGGGEAVGACLRCDVGEAASAAARWDTSMDWDGEGRLRAGERRI